MSEVVKEYGTGKLVSSHDWGMKATGFLPSHCEADLLEEKEFQRRYCLKGLAFRWPKRFGLPWMLVLLPRSLRALGRFRLRLVR